MCTHMYSIYIRANIIHLTLVGPTGVVFGSEWVCSGFELHSRLRLGCEIGCWRDFVSVRPSRSQVWFSKKKLAGGFEPGGISGENS